MGAMLRLILLFTLLGGTVAVTALAFYAWHYRRQLLERDDDFEQVKRKNEHLLDQLEEDYITTPDGRRLRVVEEDKLFDRKPIIGDDGEFIDPFPVSGYESEGVPSRLIDRAEDPDPEYIQMYAELLRQGVVTDREVRTALGRMVDDPESDYYGMYVNYTPPPDMKREVFDKLRTDLEQGRIALSTQANPQLIEESNKAQPYNPSAELPKLIKELEESQKKLARDAEMSLDGIEYREAEKRDVIQHYHDNMARINEEHHEELEVAQRRYAEKMRDIQEDIAHYEYDIAPSVALPENDQILSISKVADMLAAWKHHFEHIHREELEWYFTRPVIKKFCQVNGISRRQLHHTWSPVSTDVDPIHADRWLVENGLGVKRNDDAIDEWVQAGNKQGALSYPAKMFGIPIAYYFGTGIVLGKHSGILIMLADRKPDRKGRTRAIALERNGDVRPVTIVSLPKIEKDIDGDPDFEGKRYQSPHTHAGYHVPIEDKLIDDDKSLG